MANSKDCWATPTDLFNMLNAEFKFNLDACANQHNYKCAHYYDEVRDCLNVNWRPLSHADDLRAFMNPPYSNPAPFIKKAWQESKNGLIVCLVKADTSTRWWATFWDYDNNQPRPGCEVRFLPKRVKFTPPQGGIAKNCAAFPSAVVIMDRRGNKC
jgi:phage N-6-adenine-methyltransferase